MGQEPRTAEPFAHSKNQSKFEFSKKPPPRSRRNTAAAMHTPIKQNY
jgi:hypothetical protein